MKPFNDTYVMYQLLEFIDEGSIITLCKASKKLNEICKQYIEMEDDKRFEIYATKSNWDNSILLLDFCMNNDVLKIRKIITMNIELSWGNGLCCACEGGNLDIIKLMIEKGAHCWNLGLFRACKAGHKDIVNLMIEKGATRCGHNLICRKTIKQHLKS